MKRDYRGLFLASIILQGLDALLTYEGMHVGFGELNPLVGLTMDAVGVGWALVLWKSMACVAHYVIFRSKWPWLLWPLSGTLLLVAVLPWFVLLATERPS